MKGFRNSLRMWILQVSHLLVCWWRCRWRGIRASQESHMDKASTSKSSCWPPESPHPCSCICCRCRQQLLHFGSQRQEASLLPPAFWSPANVSWWQNLTGNQLARSPGNVIFRIPAPSVEWSVEGQVWGWEVIGKWAVNFAGSKYWWKVKRVCLCMCSCMHACMFIIFRCLHRCLLYILLSAFLFHLFDFNHFISVFKTS